MQEFFGTRAELEACDWTSCAAHPQKMWHLSGTYETYQGSHTGGEESIKTPEDCLPGSTARQS